MRDADGRQLDRREVRAEAGWAWPFPLPYPMGLACGGVAFVGGQLPLDEAGRPADAGNLVAQTGRALESTRRVLAALGLALDDMVKQGSFYLGESRPEVIVENQRFRSSHYTEPAGASTGVPLPAFPLEGVTIAIETVAVPAG
jgi:enamine deaminase RidA (YjgF/YER057c/UK114 family)